MASNNFQMIEEWRPIIGYDGLYEVSNMGRIKSLRRWVNRTRRPYWKKESILIPQFRKLTYLKIDLSKNDVITQADMHRLVALAFIPNTEDKPCVNHKDGNPSNNKVTNLEWVTYKENTQHWMFKQGRVKIGENHSNSKLTEEQVISIRSEYASIKTPSRKLAKKHGVSQYTILAVIKNKTWAHI